MQIIAEVIFELISSIVGHKEAQAGKVYWGLRFIFIGVVLTGFGSFLLITSIIQGAVVPQMWCGIGPFLIVGIPFLVIGIILKNNP